jgi:hypothetical protein
MVSTEPTAPNPPGGRAMPNARQAISADSAQWNEAYERCQADDESDADATVDAGADAAGGAAAVDDGMAALASMHAPAVELAPPNGAFDGVGATVVVHDDCASAVPSPAGATSATLDVAALAFTTQTVLCAGGATGIARLDFECEVRGGTLAGAVLQLSGDAEHGGIASVVVRLPQRRWRALEAQRAELTKVLGAAVGSQVLLEIVLDDAL